MARPKKNTETKAENEVIVVQKENITDFNLTAQITAGKLTSNAKELREKIEGELLNYSVERYLAKPEMAKADKAFLNKVKDSVSEKRKAVTSKWNKPLEEFLNEMTALEKSVQEASDKLNAIVKEAENKEKEEKREKIRRYWETLDFKIVSLERIFNPKWLNKTFSMTDIMKEIESAIEKITGELAMVKSIQDEDSEILQSFYLDTLDLNATLQKGQQLKANREVLKAEEERKRVEAKNAVKSTISIEKEPENTNINTKFAEKPQNFVEYQDKNEKCTEISEKEEPILSYRLEVFGTKEKLFALRRFIDANKIEYRKL